MKKREAFETLKPGDLVLDTAHGLVMEVVGIQQRQNGKFLEDVMMFKQPGYDCGWRKAYIGFNRLKRYEES